jgi:hypothetical protein
MSLHKTGCGSRSNTIRPTGEWGGRGPDIGRNGSFRRHHCSHWGYADFAGFTGIRRRLVPLLRTLGDSASAPFGTVVLWKIPPASEREARMDDPMVRSRLGRTNGTRPFGALDPKQEPLFFCRIHFHVSTLPVQFGPGMPSRVWRSNSLMAHRIDCTCCNCARVGPEELGILASLDALDNHKAEVGGESRVESREGARTV